jgi:dipicolinate synthase subunit A
VNWSALEIAVVGGDERECEIARLAAATGAAVRAWGFPWPDGGVAGVAPAPDATAAMSGANYALFPVPGLGAEGALYAPSAPNAVLPDERLLSVLAPGAHVILGNADGRLRAAAAAAGVELHEYESDPELMLLRVPAIVEGALQVAFEQTDVTIHANDVGVVGHGKTGSALARALVALGARVHVFARNPVQRAAAHVAGAVPHPLDALQGSTQDLVLLFSTVPTRVVGPEVLAELPPDAVVIDLAAPPGSVDLEAARSLGRKATWARGLGRRAPVTVGKSQWLGIRKTIEAIEEER